MTAEIITYLKTLDSQPLHGMLLIITEYHPKGLLVTTDMNGKLKLSIELA